MYLPVSLISMLKINVLMNLSASVAQIGVNYDRVDDGIIFLILKTSSSMDSSTITAQIEIEFDEVGGGSGAGSKLVKKLSKS